MKNRRKIRSLASKPLSGHKGGSSLRELDDDGAVQLLTSLQHRVDGAGARAVEGWDGVLVLLTP